MIFNSWRTAYIRTFHQLRALSLLALIFSHALTFVNYTIRLPLEGLAIFPLIKFFTPLGVSFVVLAGVTFRLAFSSDMKNGRLMRWPTSNFGLYLAGLVVLDSLKTLFVYERFDFIIHWDFLKTLLVAYFVIILLTRIHIIAVAALSFSLMIFGEPIRHYIASLRTSVTQVRTELLEFNSLHIQALILGIFILAAGFPEIIRLPMKRQWKWLGAFGLFALAGLPLLLATQLHPTLSTYVLIHNWFYDGLLGDLSTSHLYGGLSWLPTILNSFLIGHLALRYRVFFEKHSVALTAATFFLAVVSYLVYVPNLPSAPLETVIWNLPAFNRSSMQAEVFKIFSILNVFLLLALWNRRITKPPLEEGILHFSRASFFIYLLCTSISPILAPYCAEKYGFALGSILNMAVTLAAGILVAEMGQWLSRKRLRFTIQLYQSNA